MDGALIIRKVTEKDSKVLFSWRNDESVRKYSRSNRLITFDEHTEWFKKYLNSMSDSHLILIFEKNGFIVGMTRFDRISESASELSIILDPQFRGLGIGKLILQTTLEFATKNKMYDQLIATLHTENIASIRAFKSLGFIQIDQNGMFVTYSWFLKKDNNTSAI